MTRKEMKEMSSLPMGESVVIGRSWERRREIFRPIPALVGADKYADDVIIVRGMPRHGTYMIVEKFPATPAGWDRAKKFALS